MKHIPYCTFSIKMAVNAACNSRYLISLLVLSVASGCASLEDFRKMAPEQRARMVCESRPDYLELQRKIRDFEQRITDIDEALRKGIRNYRQCEQVKVYGDRVTTCTTAGNTTQCRESRPERFEKRCVDVLVPVDPRQEKENRKEWMAEKNTLQEQAGNIYGSCYKTVVKMNAEDAYGLY